MITNNSCTILPIQVPTAAVKVMEDDNNDNLRKITEEIIGNERIRQEIQAESQANTDTEKYINLVDKI
jgi:hypothetical protein